MKMLKYSLTCYIRLLKWLNKIYINDKVLEDGYHQISIYDVDSHYLLLTYRITSYGKKDGEEIEYFEKSEDIKRKTNWKNGQKNGEELEYFEGSENIKRKTNWKAGQKDGLETVWTDRTKTENEYKEGVLINNKEYFYLLDIDAKGTIQKKLKKLVPANFRARYYFGQRVVSVIIENGEINHITLNDEYHMEFKNGEMYNGYWGKNCYKEGKLTGTKVVNLMDSPCTSFMINGECCDIECWKTFENGELVSDDALYNCVGATSYCTYKIHIPVNGLAYEVNTSNSCVLWEFTMQDGKRDGEYRVYDIHTFYKDGKLNGVYEDSARNIRKNYKNDVLEGPYTEFFDKIGGKMKVSGLYQDGRKTGVWEYYAEDGTLLNQEHWHEGTNTKTSKEKTSLPRTQMREFFQRRR